MLLPFLAASLSAVLPSYEVDCDRDLVLKKYKENIIAAGNPLADKYENAENVGRKIGQQFFLFILQFVRQL
jgi:hypothetical protein